MITLLFLLLGLVFCRLLHQAISTDQILGRGWIGTRIYDRYDEPFHYWGTFVSYVLCAGVSFFVVLASTFSS